MQDLRQRPSERYRAERAFPPDSPARVSCAFLRIADDRLSRLRSRAACRDEGALRCCSLMYLDGLPGLRGRDILDGATIAPSHALALASTIALGGTAALARRFRWRSAEGEKRSFDVGQCKLDA